MSEQLETHGVFKTAKELYLSEEQRCGLIKALAYIESGKTLHVRINPNKQAVISMKVPTGFNMSCWRRQESCGTIACLGGIAEILGGAHYRFHLPPELKALFGLRAREYVDMTDITEKQAAVALRGYLETGKTDWDKARKSPR